MGVSEEEYRLDFFRENGFYRRRCRVCGSWFWTLNPEQETCSDTPCSEYDFYHLKLKIQNGDVTSVRRLFTSFFEKRGHKLVEPKPVVARWREDLYLTIASIVVFQPFVTNGIVPPPANPLVISQPCIRLEDIDYVGKTMGRHLTSFEMAAHHAFNYPDEKIYWKDETVNYAFQFFTREFGVPADLLTFKEAWWEGGGNAGPCFEVTVEGLEVATLVFMQYKTVNGSYEEIPLKIVDTGYGVERMAWLAQRTPTGFHAVYGRLLEEFHELLKVEPVEEEFLVEATRTVSTFDVERERFEELYRRVSKRTRITLERVREVLRRLESLYALLDHTRTIAFMLSDGIVPSNSGEGYLARLVIRRAIRALKFLKSKVSLRDLVDLQLEFWGRDFKRMKDRRDYILKVLSVEEEKYESTLSRGGALVSRVLKKYKGKSLPSEELVLLYDSHGLPPEFVREVASKFNVEVRVPEDFYSIVAKRHSTVEVGEGEVKALRVKDRKLPPTKMLFHIHPYMRRFKARVLYSTRDFIVLDQTCFYPEGGGAASDTGFISFEGGRVRVVNAQKVGEVIVHRIKGSVEVPEGVEVVGEVDWDNRYSIMKHHTATHIILAAARRVLGEHVWQAGAEKTAEKARLDITHYELPSLDEIREIEKLANRVVEEGRRVTINVLPRIEAEEKYGFTLYQGGVPLDPKIRVVRVEDWDVQACFGVHVENTRELGLVKIVNVEKIQDGVVRLEFVAGVKTLDYTWSLEENLRRVSTMLNVSPQDLELRVSSFLKEFEEVKKRLHLLRSVWIESELEKARRESLKIRGLNVIVRVYSGVVEEDVLELAKRITGEVEDSIVVMVRLEGGKGRILIALSEDVKSRGYSAVDILKKISGKLPVKGGGRDVVAQGLILSVDRDVESEISKILEEILK